MRIVIDARESGTSTGRYVDKLIEYLHGLKPAYDITVLTKPGRLEYMRVLAPNFKHAASSAREFTFSEQTKLPQQLRSLRPDLVHFGMTQQPLLYFGPSITTVHDLTTIRFNNPAKNFLAFKFKQLIYRLVIVWAAHKSKAIIAPSNFVRNDLANFASVKQSKIHVTYEAADKIKEPAETVPKLKPSGFLFYVGRATPHKNLVRLVEAFEIVLKTQPELKLVLAGRTDKNYKTLQNLVKRKNLTSQVIFTGKVSEGGLRWLYENCLAYVYPSLSEGFGLPALEAMVHGAPLTCSNLTSLPEICGPAALFFDPTDVNDMATKINKIAASSSLREELVDAGYKQAAKYSWAKMAAQTLAIYEQALKP